MRSGAALVPDYAMQLQQKQLMELQQQQQQLASDTFNQKVFERQQDLAKRDMYEMDVQAYLADPRPENLRALMAKYPEQSEGLKRVYEAQSANAQQANLTGMANVYGYARSGNYGAAAAELQRQMDADKAAGLAPDPMDEQLMADLRSGDPARQKQAVGLMGFGIASIVGPDKFASTYEALNPEPKTISYQAGGGVVTFDPTTGQSRPLVIPGNPSMGGSAPQSGGGGQSPRPLSRPAQTVNDLPKDATGAYVIGGDADFKLLAPGMRFVAPDGTTRVK